MGQDCSIPKELIINMISSSKEKSLIDFEIIEELRNNANSSRDRESFKKIILTVDENGPHLVATREFNSFHVYVAIVHSITNSYSPVMICGGGYIKLKIVGSEEKIVIDDESGSFGGMNINEVKAVISLLKKSDEKCSKIEVDSKHMSTAEKGKFYECSYEKLERISKNM